MKEISEDYARLRQEPGMTVDKIRRIWEAEKHARCLYVELCKTLPLNRRRPDYRTYLSNYDVLVGIIRNLPSFYAIDLLHRAHFLFENLFEARRNPEMFVLPEFINEIVYRFYFERACSISKFHSMSGIWNFTCNNLQLNTEAFGFSKESSKFSLREAVIFEMSSFEGKNHAKGPLSLNMTLSEVFNRYIPELQKYGIFGVLKAELAVRFGPLYEFIGDNNLINYNPVIYPSLSRSRELYDFEDTYLQASDQGQLDNLFVQKKIVFQFLTIARVHYKVTGDQLLRSVLLAIGNLRRNAYCMIRGCNLAMSRVELKELHTRLRFFKYLKKVFLKFGSEMLAQVS